MGHTDAMPDTKTMPDAKTKRGLDRTSIDFAQDYVVRFWCNTLGCTLNQLRAAVRTVGNNADAVRAHLKKKK